MTVFKKYKKKLFLLAFMCLIMVMQVSGQFFDDNGPGDFEPPPDNDVPLDTYQWIMMLLALLYGVYVFYQHYKKKKQSLNQTPAITGKFKIITNHSNN